MSVESIAIALHHSRSSGTTKLVLVGIANHDGDGGAWPTVATLATYAGKSVRVVQRALRELEALGEIRVEVQGGGTMRLEDRLRPNLYWFRLACPPGCDRTKNHRVGLVVESLQPLIEVIHTGDAGVTGTGDAGVTRTVIENQELKNLRKSRPRARDYGVGRCGHTMIDERHCMMGCAPADSAPLEDGHHA